MIEVNDKVRRFSEEMQNQLNLNSHKPDWNQFKNVVEIMFELDYHKAKLLLAIKEDNKPAIKEYLADMGNILMFLGNAYSLYNHDEVNQQTYEMIKGLFVAEKAGGKIKHEQNFSERLNNAAESTQRSIESLEIWQCIQNDQSRIVQLECVQYDGTNHKEIAFWAQSKNVRSINDCLELESKDVWCQLEPFTWIVKNEHGHFSSWSIKFFHTLYTLIRTI